MPPPTPSSRRLSSAVELAQFLDDDADRQERFQAVGKSACQGLLDADEAMHREIEAEFARELQRPRRGCSVFLRPAGLHRVAQPGHLS
jgi:hypothetical protein